MHVDRRVIETRRYGNRRLRRGFGWSRRWNFISSQRIATVKSCVRKSRNSRPLMTIKLATLLATTTLAVATNRGDDVAAMAVDSAFGPLLQAYLP